MSTLTTLITLTTLTILNTQTTQTTKIVQNCDVRAVLQFVGGNLNQWGKRREKSVFKTKMTKSGRALRDISNYFQYPQTFQSPWPLTRTPANRLWWQICQKIETFKKLAQKYFQCTKNWWGISLITFESSSFTKTSSQAPRCANWKADKLIS